MKNLLKKSIIGLFALLNVGMVNAAKCDIGISAQTTDAIGEASKIVNELRSLSTKQCGISWNFRNHDCIPSMTFTDDIPECVRKCPVYTYRHWQYSTASVIYRLTYRTKWQERGSVASNAGVSYQLINQHHCDVTDFDDFIIRGEGYDRTRRDPQRIADDTDYQEYLNKTHHIPLEKVEDMIKENFDLLQPKIEYYIDELDIKFLLLLNENTLKYIKQFEPDWSPSSVYSFSEIKFNGQNS